MGRIKVIVVFLTFLNTFCFCLIRNLSFHILPIFKINVAVAHGCLKCFWWKCLISAMLWKWEKLCYFNIKFTRDDKRKIPIKSPYNNHIRKVLQCSPWAAVRHILVFRRKLMINCAFKNQNHSFQYLTKLYTTSAVL